ncbi:virulence factor BrkB family protein [Basfia succiniciproducens]|uniref:virulence factor BrkB family protein n=1 Tax=Basfia succiniciproducens TaxID=653940 RepID=UPI0008BCC461|nr:virulence factor BrkB family protein [Basfia succiniciproducens]SEQ16862.1 tRNA-processing RNAse BN [Basfia succiniciproducens]
MTQLKLLFAVFHCRFQQNKLTQAAGALTYSTMLAIVPLVMVVFAIFSAFPMFNEAAAELKTFIFDNFSPSAGDTVGQYIDEFVVNSKSMSAVGIISLIAVALLLINQIDRTINDIWHSKNRNFIFSMTIYWTLLTLGPIFIGMSFAINTYIRSIIAFEGDLGLPFGLKLLSFVPFLLTWLSFSLIYTLVPNTKVNFRYAAVGALVAAIFFTLGKKAFAWYMATFPSYQLIYGAMATLPITLLWIQLSWLFILLGAQLTAVLGDMRLIKSGDLNLTAIKEKTE